MCEGRLECPVSSTLRSRRTTWNERNVSTAAFSAGPSRTTVTSPDLHSQRRTSSPSFGRRAPPMIISGSAPSGWPAETHRLKDLVLRCRPQARVGPPARRGRTGPPHRRGANRRRFHRATGVVPSPSGRRAARPRHPGGCCGPPPGQPCSGQRGRPGGGSALRERLMPMATPTGCVDVRAQRDGYASGLRPEAQADTLLA